ncbi:hypothetical protein [Streptomyces chromofuscus]|uniref:Uncharacterized protein n=1 Tax=Streptomyces chromofuscus TaxID=42881 RepID=A0A7M2T9H0_STRCW|nr:hypothetical protein [Streptomyces chromofuscus]QOV44585.1 hypothetical protein IPT68_00605 [Streptomyces chromofuscus]GGT02056.1 hypothetical protein GCM10010254_23070 [Streptomyces chromofuscus]
MAVHSAGRAVASVVADVPRHDAYREPLVANYVLEKGKRGSRRDSGPATLRDIITAEALDTAPA